MGDKAERTRMIISSAFNVCPPVFSLESLVSVSFYRIDFHSLPEVGNVRLNTMSASGRAVKPAVNEDGDRNSQIQ